MLTRQEEEAERKAVLENDRLVREQQKQREQSGTYLSHTNADEISGGGRFAAVNPTTVVGAQPLSKYPTLPSSSPWSGAQPEPGPEPPLGFDNPALESPTGVVPLPPSVATDDPAHAPSGGSLVQQPSGDLMSERAGSSLSHQDEEGSR
jgi:hypothetical protein